MHPHRGAQLPPTAMQTEDEMRVLDTLGASIVNGELQPGSVMTLRQIQEKYAVSRTAARDATVVLESMQLLEARRRVGLTVLPVSAWNALHPQVISWHMAGQARRAEMLALQQLHAAIAPAACALAAQQASIRQRIELVEAAARFESARSESTSIDATCVTLHGMILSSTRNPLFRSIASTLPHLACSTACLAVPSGTGTKLGAHLQLAQSIADGDVLAYSALGDLTTQPNRP
ncbi:hypothetical protein C5E07_16760 [Pseudoclavibacter sp. RFBJ3]|nr:hypothetical protein C5C12_17320 [Pseudoclavibacter sp. RFBJ5]PPF90244.1 hypothetical protein C5E07_16760 [Pseudoclavibacter sp. RFBJ3]PPF94923.1 hypothetical protein C5C19_17730 [Pseudoclavibacter sp. RFBH5]PPG19050.1 hypothetical protein C5E13_17345 [Pseudoclavibacter sp. RFBI4]